MRLSTVHLCYGIALAIEVLAWLDPSWMPPTAHMMGLASVTVYLASHLSLEQEVSEELTQGISHGEAASFPVIALTALAGLFVAFKFVNANILNHVLRAYLGFVGVATIADLLRPLVPARWVAKLERRVLLDTKPLPVVGALRLTALDAPLYAAGAAAAGYYLVTRSWVGNNLLGVAFSASGIARITVGRYSVAALMLLALLAYDLTMVFYTPMMIEVATKVDAPIKLLFPIGHNDQWGKPAFSLLGLGDLVVPGILLAQVLRFDALQHLRAGGSTINGSSGKKNDDAAASATPDAAEELARAADLVHAPFAKRVFMPTWIGYVIGLVITVIVMHVFKHGQPALVYLVPCTLIGSSGAAAVTGRLRALLDFEDSHFVSFFNPPEAAAADDAAAASAAGAAAGGKGESAPAAAAAVAAR